jgi:hypothetical protein
MTYRPLLLLALLTACGDDTTTTSFGGSSSTDPGTTGQSTVDPTTDGPTTDPGTTNNPTTAGTGTSTTTTGTTDTTDTTGVPGTSNTTETTGPDTTGPDTTGTTGGSGVCGVEGEHITAELVHVAEPAPCGSLEFTGQLVSDPKGPAWMLDGCPCGANCLKPDPWTLTMTAPGEWLPVLPACPRIVVDRQQGKGGCEFVAISVWDGQNPDLPALYHAGRGFQPTVAAAKELTLAANSVEQCDCDFCCDAPELWDIDVDHLGAKATVAEGATVPLGKFNFRNFESHTTGLCDAPLDVHWALRQGM